MSNNERKLPRDPKKLPRDHKGNLLSDEELTLLAVDPEKEAALLRKTRAEVKRKYGTPDHVLDKAYGIRSRPK